MAGINKVILIGNLGADVELKYTQDGRPIANINVATSETWKDRSGQKQEQTEWHRVSLFGKLAEIANQYLHKGSKVYIEGKLQTSKYQKNGEDRYATQVVVSGFSGTMQILDKKDASYEENQVSNQTDTAKKDAPVNAQNTTKDVPIETEPDDFEDDIPF